MLQLMQVMGTTFIHEHSSELPEPKR
jgi:hypothetical protein